MNCIWVLLLLCCCNGNCKENGNSNRNCCRADNNCNRTECNRNECSESDCDKRRETFCDNSGKLNAIKDCDKINCSCEDRCETESRRDCNYNKDCDNKWNCNAQNNVDAGCFCEGNMNNRNERYVYPQRYSCNNNYDNRAQRCDTCGCDGE